jgi:uncharacterized protein YggE
MRKVTSSWILAASISCLACAAVAHTALAQQAAPISGPQIVTSGSGEVEIPPTQAGFSIGIVTTAAAAAPASEENARISKAVLEALKSAGLKREEIDGSQLYVNPRWDWDEKSHRQKRSAFEATNTIQIKTENIAQVGSFIDAALSAGATNTAQVEFSAKDMDAARHQALARAVTSARSDAEAIAKAGGGALGELLLLSTERSNDISGGVVNEIALTAMRRSPEPVSTEVVPSQIKVTAQVTARWRFLPSTAPK